ncbi:PemK-like, MazF-like toxin of type II toxin-antitoxin system [Nonomuraea solani]|uniref:PemK-like, MazF-like toxin of type II toxin-antitoxin system n=1 Tax=Nonomuraea solani TaxID=1144553 RepID=A0A1H6F2L8_9ACTN|nr:type II toxin-antitoxin system PemK/MazF family toxin [Nonomuraea solani]SEH03305.1 PemK-like, MazF-like toxin of type II toxin-antitoxin system [Nonomuraea solani]
MRDLGDDPRPSRGAVREIHTLTGPATLAYSPDLDGLADPGEIVWAWVPYEEDPNRGKDRPLLIVGRTGRRLLGMMLSSRGDDGPDWLELGPWGRDGRVSYVRLDRAFVLDEDDIRREGAVLDADRFARVAARLMKSYGWKV